VNACVRVHTCTLLVACKCVYMRLHGPFVHIFILTWRRQGWRGQGGQREGRLLLLLLLLQWLCVMKVGKQTIQDIHVQRAYVTKLGWR